MSGEINKDTVGILSGEGALPIQLVQYCIENGIPVCMIQFEGCAYQNVPDIPILKTRLEKVGEIFKFLRSQSVQNVVMIGNLNRPEIASLRPDFRGIKTLMRIGSAFLKGDDNLLRSLRKEIEGEGFAVRGVDYYLTNMTAKSGALTQKQCKRPINDAVAEALRFGAQDKGQSILYHADGTYSYETRAGTAHLIQEKGKKGSILIKLVKPQQDPDLDRPTVGVDTLSALHDIGGEGMVVQADGVLMIDKHNMVTYADAHDLFIEVVDV